MSKSRSVSMSRGGGGAGYDRKKIDARQAAEQGAVVVTTLAALRRFELFARLHRRNLRMLMKHGVKIAIGTDQYRRTTDTETNYLRGLELFDNLTLLKMWCETTPQTIFPNRKIARLEEGYEASFLVLEMNPLDDLDHLDSIDMRFKRGSLLTLDFE